MQGMCRVATFLPNIEYINRKRGEGGVELVLKELGNRGYQFDFRKMKKMDWVPLNVRVEFLKTVMDALEWDEERIKDMGVNAVKTSFIIRNFIGLFMNIKKLFEIAPDMWQKHYTIGRLKNEEYTSGRALIVLEDFDIDPIICKYLEGYFEGVGRLTGKKNMHVKEVKCTFKGDERHEFLVTWKE